MKMSLTMYDIFCDAMIDATHVCPEEFPAPRAQDHWDESEMELLPHLMEINGWHTDGLHHWCPTHRPTT